MTEAPFQLGVTRSVPHDHGSTSGNPVSALSHKEPKSVKNSQNKSTSNNKDEEVLRPIEDAISWSGSSNSSDMLF